MKSIVQTILAEKFQQWVDSHRYKLGSEFNPPEIGFSETRYWISRDDAMRALMQPTKPGRYKEEWLKTSVRGRNGRWKFLSRETTNRAFAPLR